MRNLNTLVFLFVIIFNFIELSSQGNKKSKASSSRSNVFVPPENSPQSSRSSSRSPSPSSYEWGNQRQVPELSSQGNKKTKESSSRSDAFVPPEDNPQSSSLRSRSPSPSRYEWGNMRPPLAVQFPAILSMRVLLETHDTLKFESELDAYSDYEPPPRWMTEPFFHDYFNVFMSLRGPGRRFNSKSSLQGPYARGNPAPGHAPNIGYINLGAIGRFHTITKFKYFNVNKEQLNGDYYDKIFVTIPGTQLVYYSWIEVYRPRR